MPGFAFQAADPDAFASRDDVLQFIESYAAFIHAPLRCGLAATALCQTPNSTRLIVETQANLFEAKNVVTATGPFQVPVDPLPIGGRALQLHSSQYRNPEQLPPGAVPLSVGEFGPPDRGRALLGRPSCVPLRG